MKRLEKNQISELRETMPVLDCYELQAIIGGDGKKYSYNNSGQLVVEDLAGGSGTKDVVVINNVTFELNSSVTQEGNTISFPGDKDLFQFLADLTSTEIGYGYNNDGSSGTIYTSGQQNVVYPLTSFKQYDNYVHSHDTKLDALNLSDERREEVLDVINGLPSDADVQSLNRANLDRVAEGKDPIQGIIYDERSRQWKKFDSNTQTQDQYLKDNGLWPKKGGQNNQ